jgi:hypothetical protein
VSLGGQQAELALVDEALEVLDLLLERGLLEVLCGVRVGGLAAGVCVGEGRHFEGLFVDGRKGGNQRTSNAVSRSVSKMYGGCLVERFE